MAAILMQKYPGFSVQDIRGVLLHSAQRSFIIPISKYTLKHVCETMEEMDSLKKAPPLKGVKVEFELFDPSKYGQGIANLDYAFIYADLKIEHPEKTPEELRSLMLKKVKEKEHQQATILQKYARGYLVRKNKILDRKKLEKLKNIEEAEAKTYAKYAYWKGKLEIADLRSNSFTYDSWLNDLIEEYILPTTPLPLKMRIKNILFNKRKNAITIKVLFNKNRPDIESAIEEMVQILEKIPGPFLQHILISTANAFKQYPQESAWNIVDSLDSQLASLGDRK